MNMNAGEGRPVLQQVRYAGNQPTRQQVEAVQKRRQQAAVNGADWQLCAKGVKENNARKDTGGRARRNPRRLQLKPPRAQKLPRTPRGRFRERGRRERATAKAVGDPDLLLPGLPSAKNAP